MPVAHGTGMVPLPPQFVAFPQESGPDHLSFGLAAL